MAWADKLVGSLCIYPIENSDGVGGWQRNDRTFQELFQFRVRIPDRVRVLLSSDLFDQCLGQIHNSAESACLVSIS